jgi:ubiquinone/menaquinone biosynthesis C-methylase UbiE
MNIKDLWNERAELGTTAGTQDLIAKELEIRELSKYIKDSKNVLDFGCGDGTTAIELAKKHPINILGMDFSEKMIENARKKPTTYLKGCIEFEVGDVLSLKSHKGIYDCIYTERMLINLASWQSQLEAMTVIFDHLQPGGRYIMCENSQDGLRNLNELRISVGLSVISPPSHNLYINDSDIECVMNPGVILEEVIDYSSTYYFISRVVNAWQSKQKGKEPSYDAPINNIALDLPPMGNAGQGRIWVWKKLTYEERVSIVKKVEEAYRHRTLVD